MVVNLDPSEVYQVQFINPWSLQHDYGPKSRIPFFIISQDPTTLRELFLRYEVVAEDIPGMGVVVHRPILRQKTNVSQSLFYDIVSPTVVADDLGMVFCRLSRVSLSLLTATFWGMNHTITYNPDISSDPYTGRRARELTTRARIVLRHTTEVFQRHRVGIDPISGRVVKSTGNTILVAQLIPTDEIVQVDE
jgi:hypothetical protein